MPPTRRRLLLHAGTPKTGTKSLQAALHASRDRLRAAGVLYPEAGLSPDLKHQWMVNCLVAGDLEQFRGNLRQVVEEADDGRISRVVLSTEGIFHHWTDFSQAARLALAELLRHFDVTVWTVFREPLSFAMSLYSQFLKNPPSHLTHCYATTSTPEEIADDPWFARRLDYAGFIAGIEGLLGSGCLVATPYEGDTVAQARAILGLDETILPGVPSRNHALSALGADLMIRLNRLHLDGAERERMAAAIIDIDRRLCRPDESLVPSGDMARRVAALSADSARYLERRFGIRWPARRGAAV